MRGDTGIVLRNIQRAWPLGERLRAAMPILLGVFLALIAIQYGLPSAGRVGPFRIQLGARVAGDGQTTLSFPPFGEVSALTHRRIPLEVRLTLVGVDLPELKNWVGEKNTPKAALTSAEGALGPLAWSYLWRTLALAAGLGAAGAYLGFGRRQAGLTGAVAAVLTVGVLAGGTALTFDREAFARPRYQGALEAAPWMIGLLEKSWGQVGSLGAQMEAVARNLSGLSDQLSGLTTVGRPPRDLKILHVSDLHNNPLGSQFIAEAVKSFGVDAVIDTGDLTDWGTQVETGLVEEITRLGVPYFFVPGNHDSPELLRELRRYPSVRVLGTKPVTFRGLTILSAPDPSSVQNDPSVAGAQVFAELGQELAVRAARLARPPDIVAVHNALMARPLAGKVPVVLNGHDHRLSVREAEGTTWIDAGTSGAAGIRGLEERKEVPYSMVLLYFARNAEGYRLRTIDTLEVRGRSAGFTLNRILVGDGGNPKGSGEPLMDGARLPASTNRQVID